MVEFKLNGRCFYSGMVLVPIKKSVVVVCEGCGTTLMVQVMSYSPPYHVQWYMNSSFVKTSDLYLISNISVSDASTVPITYVASLTISSVNLTTQGFYWASFYDHGGVATTTTIFLTNPGRQGIDMSISVILPIIQYQRGSNTL